MNFKCQAFEMRCVFKRYVDTAQTRSSLTITNHICSCFSATAAHVTISRWLQASVSSMKQTALYYESAAPPPLVLDTLALPVTVATI